MDRKIDWQVQLGRRLKLRDLHVFQTVAECGSMAKAASKLGVSQPTVSEVVADLERTYRTRLLDRSSRGVELTIYGAALLKRSVAAFDELRQSGRDIDFLSQPSTGELRIGSAESVTATILSLVVTRFAADYPRVVLHLDDVASRGGQLSGLRDRKFDLIFLRMQLPFSEDPLVQSGGDDLTLETIFDDRLVIAAGAHSRWARRRKIDLREIADQPWILMSPGTWNFARVSEAFHLRGLDMPKISLVTNSVHLRTNLLANGPFITALPQSIMLADSALHALTVLPVELPARRWPVVIATLKNRTLSPVVERFVECTRKVGKSISLANSKTR